METLSELVARSHSTHAQSVKIFLANSIMLPDDALDGARKAELKSESYRLIGSFLDLARQHCENGGLSPGSDEALDAFGEAHKTATSIVYAYEGLPFSMDERKALSPDQVTEKLALLVPPHATDLVAHVKRKGKLDATQDWLSQAVGDYVTGRFKSPAVDRTLVRALTQVEMVAYVYEMLWKNPLTKTSKLEDAHPPSVVKAIWNVFKLMVLLWLVCIGIAALPLVFSALPLDAMLIGSFALATIGTIALLALLVLGLIGIFREKPKKRKLYSSVLEMIDRMNGFFLEFKSAGPFSTAHFRKRVNELADAGVVWPSGLFVLLDDMEARGVRSF